MPENESAQNSTPTPPHRSSTKPGADRIIALTDGVIAISITLLAFNFKVPEGLPRQDIGSLLWGMLPMLEMYIATFLLIGYFWYMHHTLFQHVQRHDTVLLWLNLLWLLPLTALPFVTELIGKYPDEELSTAVYFGTLFLAATFQAILWMHARKRRYTAELSAGDAWHANLLVVTTLLIFGLGLTLSFFQPNIAQRVYLLMLLPLFVRKRFAPVDNDGDQAR